MWAGFRLPTGHGVHRELAGAGPTGQDTGGCCWSFLVGQSQLVCDWLVAGGLSCGLLLGNGNPGRLSGSQALIWFCSC